MTTEHAGSAAAQPSAASAGYGERRRRKVSDQLPARICTVPPFDDSDKAIGGGCLLVMLALFVLASLWRTESLKPPPKAEAEKLRTVTVCSGCGSEWESFDDKPSDPITKCPNCPMSEEEWEALKEQMRKRTEKP